MCLDAKNVLRLGKKKYIFVHMAHKDIQVYKVLDYDYTSPFRRKYYRFGLNKPLNPNTKRFLSGDKIKDGFLHAFVSINAALYTYPWASKVVEMIIPKGTLYVRGLHGEICATCLKW